MDTPTPAANHSFLRPANVVAQLAGSANDRGELSDYAIRYLRERGLATEDMFAEETQRANSYRIAPNADGLRSYLRCRRVGSHTVLNRTDRAAVFAVLALRGEL